MREKNRMAVVGQMQWARERRQKHSLTALEIIAMQYRVQGTNKGRETTNYWIALSLSTLRVVHGNCSFSCIAKLGEAGQEAASALQVRCVLFILSVLGCAPDLVLTYYVAHSASDDKCVRPSDGPGRVFLCRSHLHRRPPAAERAACCMHLHFFGAPLLVLLPRFRY